MDQGDIATLVAFAERLADLSRPIAQRYFRSAIDVEEKPDRTPVTLADREAEAAMRGAIARVWPNHGVVGEEFGSENAEAEHVWFLDPIDGTKGFIAGVPLFGTLIGLARGGRPLLGVIDHPALGERWVGAIGRPTTHNGAPVRCRPCAALERAQLFATDPGMFDGEDALRFERVRTKVRRVRFGTDCYGYGLLASGFGDLVVEADLDPTDFVPLVPVVEGAGGAVRDWQGRAIGPGSSGHLLAVGDARLLDPALALLA